MDTTTYASLAAIPWSVAESSRHSVIPEVEFIPLDLCALLFNEAKPNRHSFRVKVRTRLDEIFTEPQREELMSGGSMSAIFTPTGPLVYRWQIDRLSDEVSDELYDQGLSSQLSR